MFKEFVIAASLVLATTSWAQSSPLKQARGQIEKGLWSQGLANLMALDDKMLSLENQQVKYFTMGKGHFDKGDYKLSQFYLKKSIKLGSVFLGYSNYLLGVMVEKEGKRKSARRHFIKALNAKPPRNIVYEVRFELGKLDMKEKRWRRAYRNFRYVDRRWRNTAKHPEVIWNLIKVELKRRRKWKACRWARKIYSKYPSHPLVADWGIDLQKSRYEGKVLGCMASPRDQKSRMKRFQWSGQSGRALEEIKLLQGRTTPATEYNVDSMLADYYVREGLVEESLKLILKHYEKQKRHFSYLMLLGKASARAGEFQAAVGTYYKAYRLSPRSRSGRKALFRAAFLSYQFQDYDGAIRKFRELIKRFPRSGLSRDAYWHQAWVRYLKGDYEGAVQSFKSVLAKKKRKRWRWRKFSTEKINYWLAMSYFRLGDYQSAKVIFKKVAEDRLLGFYAMASQYRLLLLPGVQIEEVLAIQGVIAKRAVASVEGAAVSLPSAILPSPEDMPPPSEEGDGEEEESEDNIKIAAEETSEKDEADEDDEEAEEDEIVEVSSVTDPDLKRRFQRAQKLMKVGLNDWAKWELYEVERRTSNTDYLKMLMGAYEGVKAFNRSSYVSAINFSRQRKRYGVTGVRYLWEYAYPRAYNDYVESSAKIFQIPKELVWSIMRAETMYRPDITSPVGAKGLMQIMPHTGRKVAKLMGDEEFSGETLAEPQVNVRLGTRYLRRLGKKFDEQLPLMAAGYNAGPHRVEAWLRQFGDRDMDEFIEHIPFIETRNYVKKVVRNFGIYQTLYVNKNMAMAWLSKPVPIKRQGPPPFRETWEAL